MAACFALHDLLQGGLIEQDLCIRTGCDQQKQKDNTEVTHTPKLGRANGVFSEHLL
jgi:hypothetical protein